MAGTRRRGAHAAGTVAEPSARPARAPNPAGAQRPAAGTKRKPPAKPRPRPSRAKVVTAVLVVGLGTMAFAGGLTASPSAEPTVEAFLLDWQQQQYQAAAALTDGNPGQVAAALKGAYEQLDAAAFYLSMGHISQQGSAATAKFQASVDLGQDGAPWNYYGKFELRRSGSTWRVVWGPSVINPALKPGYRLAVQSNSQPRQVLLDASGAPLVRSSGVWEVGVQPDQLRDPAATAAGLGRITKLDASQLLGWIRAASGTRFRELVVLRQTQYKRMAAALHRVHGLLFRHERMQLFDSIAPAVVGRVDSEASAAFRDEGIAYRPGATIGRTGLQLAYQHQLAGTPTTEVVMETAAGQHVTVLKSWPGTTPRPVRTTIDATMQRAAARAVASAAPGSAAVVAVRASTGQVLAVADQKGRGIPAVDPLNGGYPPGTAFTLVSASALLARQFPVNRPVPCGPQNWVGGDEFKNVLPVSGLGPNGSNGTFGTDFVHACSTGFANLSLLLRPTDLTNMVGWFGLGTQWSLQVPAFWGSVQTSGGQGVLAADSVGLGGVRMSPLAMALAAARVDSGTQHAPSLVLGPRSVPAAGSRPSTQTALSPAALATLRSLLGSAARVNGANKADAPGQAVAGQVGAAPFTVGKRQIWASWFVGYRGDVAIAAVEFTRTAPTSALAVPLATRFLRAVKS